MEPYDFSSNFPTCLSAVSKGPVEINKMGQYIETEGEDSKEPLEYASWIWSAKSTETKTENNEIIIETGSAK